MSWIDLADRYDDMYGEQPDLSPAGAELYTLREDEYTELVQYHGRERDVVIPPGLGIRCIGPHAFGDPGDRWNPPDGLTQPVCDWEHIRSVVIPRGVARICCDAFKGCTSLESVTLPSTLERIEPGAFEGCKRLSVVTLVGEGCSGTFHRSAFAGCPVASEVAPIAGLPDTATLVNDTAFPGMFDGPPHELRTLMFRTDGMVPVRSLQGLTVVDPGIEGLNRFSRCTPDRKSPGFWVQINDGCDQGFYAVKSERWAGEPSLVIEGYLEPAGDGRAAQDPSRREFTDLMGSFAVYLHNCHLVPHPSIDGARAARLVDDYRAEVAPLVEEFRKAEAAGSHCEGAFDEDKLETLDELYAQIRSANNRLIDGARPLGLDAAYYVQQYAAELGSGPTPSERAAQIQAERRRERLAERRKNREVWINLLASILLFLLKGCGWLFILGLSAFVYLALLLILLL